MLNRILLLICKISIAAAVDPSIFTGSYGFIHLDVKNETFYKFDDSTGTPKISTILFGMPGMDLKFRLNFDLEILLNGQHYASGSILWNFSFVGNVGTFQMQIDDRFLSLIATFGCSNSSNFQWSQNFKFSNHDRIIILGVPENRRPYEIYEYFYNDGTNEQTTPIWAKIFLHNQSISSIRVKDYDFTSVVPKNDQNCSLFGLFHKMPNNFQIIVQNFRISANVGKEKLEIMAFEDNLEVVSQLFHNLPIDRLWYEFSRDIYCHPKKACLPMLLLANVNQRFHEYSCRLPQYVSYWWECPQNSLSVRNSNSKYKNIRHRIAKFSSENSIDPNDINNPYIQLDCEEGNENDTIWEKFDIYDQEFAIKIDNNGHPLLFVTDLGVYRCRSMMDGGILAEFYVPSVENYVWACARTSSSSTTMVVGLENRIRFQCHHRIFEPHPTFKVDFQFDTGPYPKGILNAAVVSSQRYDRRVTDGEFSINLDFQHQSEQRYCVKNEMCPLWRVKMIAYLEFDDGTKVIFFERFLDCEAGISFTEMLTDDIVHWDCANVTNIDYDLSEQVPEVSQATVAMNPLPILLVIVVFNYAVYA